MDDRPIMLGTLPDGRRLHLGDAAGQWPAGGGVLLIRGQAPATAGRTYFDEIISQSCRTSATHVIDLVEGDYSWMLEGMRTLSRSMGEACMKVGEIFGGMHEDRRGTTVIVNGAESLQADAHSYSSLLAEKLNHLIASPPQGGASLVLAGRDLDVSMLLVEGLNGAHRIQFSGCGQTNSTQYLLGDLQHAVIPGSTAIYEGPFGSPSTFFSPLVGSGGRSTEDAFLELPIGIEGASFSTAWAQNLVVRGGSRSDRSQLIAAMAKAAQESCVLTWVAASAPDSAPSANWRHHRETMSTGVVQGRELLRLVCDQVFPRMDACRELGTKDVRDLRIPADLARPIAIFVDDLDVLTKETADQPEVEESAKAVETLIGFLAQTASQTNVSLIVGTAADLQSQSADVGLLWTSAAQLQLAPYGSAPGSDEAPLYFAAPGLPAITLEVTRV
ncbi:hypothetical protein [Arthrobacter sp. SLBN-122]|uniref:hypothetical protein n=1 Tax=Arthrobacter sp. SLBN-122 TaxID=2768455 RepID=UPI001151D5D7|nr:hypothetical protein [Arthrobacter sp. SLBN-122]TQJ35599.1 hypothetical protein FBY36_2872 [Arthrobacter sp. SLBN-122]